MIGETLIGTLANIHCDECEQIIAAQIDPEETLQNLRTGTIYYIVPLPATMDNYCNLKTHQGLVWQCLKCATRLTFIEDADYVENSFKTEMMVLIRKDRVVKKIR